MTVKRRGGETRGRVRDGDNAARRNESGQRCRAVDARRRRGGANEDRTEQETQMRVVGRSE